ncbi:uncharacterized protein [Haliotis cracherodii]|uniref:uncharacterized protein n=1 Tax=Haliotis cracherodii TaxID=6455 RepID=UPI0039EB4036
MIMQTSLSVCTCLILFIISETAGRCEFKHRLRDKWYFQGQNRNTFIRIRRSAVQFHADRNHRIRYKCVESRGNIYLMRKNRFEPSKDGVLCIGFSYLADHPNAEFSLVRLMSPGVSSHIMSPKVIGRGSKINIDNSCEFLQGHDRRLYTFIKRRSPGCKFPSKLLGDWNYTYRHAHHLTFAQSNLTLQLLNGERYIFYCDSRDRDNFVIRNVGYRGTDRDAIMCMRLDPLEEDPFYDFQLSRTNSGTDMDGKLMLVERGKRVLLHTDCDWLDSPARPEYIYPL